MKSRIKEREVVIGFLLNIASAFVFYFATAVVRLHSEVSNTSPEMHAFIRYLTGFVSLSIYLKVTGFAFRWNVPKEVILRSFFNTIAVMCFYRAVVESSAGRANVMNMTYPAFVALLAGPFLKEKPGKITIIALIFCLIGVAFHFFDENNGSFHFQTGDIWGIASGILASFAILALRGAAKITTASEILLWMFATGSIVLLPFILPEISDLTYQDGFYLIVSAMLGVSGQWFLTLSYHKLTAPTGSILSSLRIPIAVVFGFFFLSEAFSLPSWTGALFIFGANVLLAFFHHNQKE